MNTLRLHYAGEMHPQMLPDLPFTMNMAFAGQKFCNFHTGIPQSSPFLIQCMLFFLS